MSKYRNNWLDEDYGGFNSNYEQFKKKPKVNVEVKRDKNKTQSRFRQPTYDDLVSTYGKDEDWN
jgi:hypothetical protein